MAYTCPRCGWTSHNPEDEDAGYCGRCRDWTRGELPRIEEAISDGGGWVCEEHPYLEFPHDDCPGPGMLYADAVAQGMRTT